MAKYALCIGIIILTALAAQFATSSAPAGQSPMIQSTALRELPLVDQLSVPTPKNYGRLATLSLLLYTREKTKTLLCKTTEDACIIRNMPLLEQGDGEVRAALVDFVEPYATDGKITHKGKTWTVPDLVKSMMSNGCYTASQVTVAATSLANRAPDVSLSALTKDLGAITAGGNLSKAQRQLLWAYKNHFLNKFDKKVRHLNFPGVVADVGGGIQQSCDPLAYTGCSGQKVTATNNDAEALWQKTPSSAELTNESVKSLMLKDRIVLLAYGRLQPDPSYDTKTKTLTVTFTKKSQHKVVVSGFQPGPFPLLINDVGNGQRYRARLSSDLGSLKFSDARGIEKVQYMFADPVWRNRPFLVYEGGDKKIAPLVFFVEGYDYLWIRTSAKPQPNPKCEKIRDEIKALRAQIKQIQSAPGYIQGPNDPRPGKPDPEALAEVKKLQAKIASLNSALNNCNSGK